MVSQAYASLVREWTVRTQNRWRIAEMHSAGLYVKAQSDIVPVQDSLDLKMHKGGKAPNEVALAALFDNNFFNYAYKEQIKQSAWQHKARGLRRKTFSRYDYIILFNRLDRNVMERLRDATQRQLGKQFVNKDKGKLVLLGEYGKSGNAEIWEPRKEGEEKTQKREDWNRTVANIKLSFKAFLKKELGWVQPSKGANQTLE